MDADRTDEGATDTGPTVRQLDFVEQEVRRQLVGRRRRRDRDRSTAFALQLATVGLSAAITVLLGVRVDGAAREWLADSALGLGALITVLAAWQAFFGHRTLWIQRSETVHRLEELERRIAYHRAGLGGAAPEAGQVDGFLAEYERIARLDHDAWARIRQASDPQPAAADAVLAEGARTD
ncbi:SLATT domain-containing protein [Kitasatospora paranensis]|uniref:SLATT domain-containing protein n=1 Tax=Kitasatospora paranensis TaxID=258053 RepID=A0ABW2G3E5_9ACTN